MSLPVSAEELFFDLIFRRKSQMSSSEMLMDVK